MSNNPAIPTRVKRILIAEDDNVTRRLITFKLEREGYHVEAALNGEELMQHATTGQPPDLMVLDLMMPVRDGFSTLRQLKQQPALANIPVIMLTGNKDEDEILRCLNAGAADYIVKPFSPDELVVRIRKLTRS